MIKFLSHGIFLYFYAFSLHFHFFFQRFSSIGENHRYIFSTPLRLVMTLFNSTFPHAWYARTYRCQIRFGHTSTLAVTENRV